jgi:uncharacterized protein (TIGR02466 family)
MAENAHSPEQVQVRNAFATPIVMAMLGDFEKLNVRLKKTILAREKKMPPATGYDSNIGGWHSDRDFLKWGGKAGQQVAAAAQEIAERMTASRSGRLIDLTWQVNAWANINRRGHSNEFHVHPGCDWSGVYYVDDGGCAEDASLGGEFVIADPRGPGPSMVSPELCFTGPGGQSVGATELVRPRAGVILVFPAWLSHAVRPYHGDATRISISFNLSAKQA